MSDFLGFITGLVVGLWAWPFLTLAVILIVFAFGLGYEKEGWVTTAFIIILGSTVFSFWKDISGWSMFMYTFGYIGIGCLMTYPLYRSYSRRKAWDWKEMRDNFLKDKEPSWLIKNNFLRDWYINNVEQGIIKSTGKDPRYLTKEDFEKVVSEETKQKALAVWRTYYKEQLLHRWNSTNWILQVESQGEAWTVTHIKKYLVGQMILWMTYWPSYTLVMLLRDAMRQFWEWVIERIGGHFQRISTEHFNAA